MTYIELLNAVQSYTQNIFPDTISADGSIVTSSEQIDLFIRQAEDRIYNSVLIPALRKNVTGTTSAGNKYVSCPDDFLSVLSLAVIDGDGNYEYLLDKDVNFIRAAYPNPNIGGLPAYYALFGPTVASSVISKELSFILGPTPDDDYGLELHYYYYPESIIQSPITGLTLSSGGSGYTNGIYYSVPLTGGKGTGATADVTITNGVVTAIQLVTGGSLYTVGDVLSASGLGSGVNFSVNVGTVGNASGTTWLSENYSPVLLYGTLVEAYTYMKGEQDMLQAYQQKYQEAMGQLIRLGGALERGDTYRGGQFKMDIKAQP